MRHQTSARAALRNGAAALLATLALIAGVLVGAPATAAPQAPAERGLKALSGSSFNAGDIISDALFYDSHAMTAAEIQNFLNAKIGTCTNGKCLNVIKITPAAQPAKIGSTTGNLVCGPVAGGTVNVATYIYRIQVACGISAKVILATLQKEQGLVTKSAPSDYAIKFAMGMDCPDTTGCSSSAGGLASQLYRGSRQLVIYKKDRFGKQPGVQPILYSPNSCGSSMVNVKNYATAALYNYTPYQPNAAALANLTGTGNSCSSYGNRNFWYYYSTWFGSTHGAAFGWIDSGPGILAVDGTGALNLWGGSGKTTFKGETLMDADGWSGYRWVQSVGDFDGDGNRDVIAVDPAGALWYWPTDGLSTLGDPVKIGDGWGDYRDVLAVNDLSGDGSPDILTRDAAGAVVLHPGTGLGKLKADIPVATGWGSYTALVGPGDFTGDNKADLIARGADGKLFLFKGAGTGAIGGAIQIGAGWNIFDVIVGGGDFTGDKRNDLVVRMTDGTVKVYPGNGTGKFLAAKIIGHGFAQFTSIGGLGQVPGSVVTVKAGPGDLKYDGRRDIIARLATDGTLYVYPNAGSNTFLKRIVAGKFPGMNLIFGADDYDRNGTVDVLMRDADGTVWAYPSNKAGGFGTRKQVATGWGDYTYISGAGDLNKDRLSDLIAKDSAGKLWLLPGDGVGGFGTPVLVGAGWTDLLVVTPGDFNSDGISDVIMRDTDGTLWLYPGTGSGTWNGRVVIGRGWNIFDSVSSPGDFTGDGIPDLIARDSAGALWLYPGSGTGAFNGRKVIGAGWQIFDLID